MPLEPCDARHDCPNCGKVCHCLVLPCDHQCADDFNEVDYDREDDES
jgi:hypothetical protein